MQDRGQYLRRGRLLGCDLEHGSEGAERAYCRAHTPAGRSRHGEKGTDVSNH